MNADGGPAIRLPVPADSAALSTNRMMLGFFQSFMTEDDPVIRTEKREQVTQWMETAGAKK